MSYKDITGQRFGRLVAVKMYAEKYKRTKWLCKCDCGNEKLMPLDSLMTGRAKSCGCYRKEVTRDHFRKHGLGNERLYSIWLNMRTRCFNPKVKSYKDYGGRGITVCKEWDDFTNFYQWSLNNGYEDNLTIDRIDNDGNYEPSNCRWGTRVVQMNNTSQNVKIEINGELKTLADHARDNKLNYDTLHYRYECGLQGEELIKPSTRKHILIEINGVTKDLKNWSMHYEIPYSTLQHRYYTGVRGMDLFKPVNKVMSENAKKRHHKKEGA